MSITVKDVADMVERVDEKLSPLTRYDGFQPYEGIYRLGDWGYVTETEYNKAFEHEDGWAQDAYILDGNGVSHTRISQLINEDDTGKAISDYINERLVVPEFLRTLVFARPRGDDQFADCTFSPSLDMSR